MRARLKEVIDDCEIQARIEAWLEGPYDEASKQEIERRLVEDPQSLKDAFFSTLSFGTGGLRGIMGVGSYRMNIYTIRLATQGLANYLHKQFPHARDLACFIGFDSRHNSRLFAEETAKVLAGNGIKALLCRHLRPTPLVSYGCRHYSASAAVMITASHNPPDYNGYKVYWSDGGQILPPHDTGILQEIQSLASMQQVHLAASLEHPLIIPIGQEIDDAYLEAAETLQLHPATNQRYGKQLKIVYSSFHGAGITLIPQMLARYGFEEPILVSKQCDPDGNFPTVKSPNPEDPEALKLGIETMLEVQADLLLATDPDADRVGVAVLHHGKAVILNGNQIACICLKQIIEAIAEKQNIPPRTAFVKTLPTTELFAEICASYGYPCFNVPTGFKYIAQQILHWEHSADGYHYLFGGEESFGYLLGTFVRDKDGVSSCALIGEVALQAKLQGKTLVDFMEELYSRYGYYYEALCSIAFPETQSGKLAMQSKCERLKAAPPEVIANVPVVRLENYETQEWCDLRSGERGKLDLHAEATLLLILANGIRLFLRPSGTEPKIKIYAEITQPYGEGVEESCASLVHSAFEDLKNWFKI